MARGLRVHLVRLMLTALVVVMGVAFVCGSQLLSDTVKQGFNEVFSLRYEGTDVVVRSPDSLFTFSGQQRAPVRGELVANVKQTNGVRAAEGIVQAPVRLLGKDGKALTAAGEAVALQTYGLNWAADDRINQWRIVEGRPPAASGEVVVDQKLATDKGFRIGDQMSIPFAQGTIPFTVVGVARFQTNPNYSGSTAVLFDTPTAQKHLVADGQFSWIAVSAEPGTSPAEMRTALQRSVSSLGNIQAMTGAEFTKEDQDLYQRLISVVNAVLVIFGCVALFVSTFVIYNTFSLIIAQRTRELALLRAFGARRLQVVAGVVFEALLVGVVASLIGLVAGVVFATLISRMLEALGFLPTNPSLVIKAVSFVPAFVMGVVVTLTAGFFPAVRASRIPPVAAMRDHQVERGAYSHARVALGALLSLVGIGLLWWGLTRTNLTNVAIGMALVFLGIAVLAPVFVAPISGVLGLAPAATRGVTGVLARENARRNPKRTAATTSAVMIGVALVTFIALIGESFRVATEEAVDLAVVGDFVVNAPTVGLSGVSPEVTRLLNEQPGVQAAASFRVGVAVANGRPSLFFGVDPARLQQVVKFDVPQGSLQDLGSDGVAVAKKLADENHLSIGSPLHVHFQGQGKQQPAETTTTTPPGSSPTTSPVTSPTASPPTSPASSATTPPGSATSPPPTFPRGPTTPRGPAGADGQTPSTAAPAITPPLTNDRILTVKAIFDSELLRGSAGLLVTQEVFEMGFSEVQQTDLQVYVKLKPGVTATQARRDLQPIVDKFPPAELQDLTEFKKDRTAPIDRVVTFIWALLLMAVLISAIGILNTLMLSVYERTRELGMLRAAGMSRRQVRSSVRWEALIISIMGTVLGLSIGLFFGWAFIRAAADEGLRTFAVPTGQLVVIVLLAGAIGVIAAILPARRAANLDVLDAIATE